ncbi:hypothetical protein KP509_15G032300 [Ceratopteris richardii]|nr:hypothetical protein KP509_15G032300 [Ceratopteris richardii]KAH7404567.1 hypothetical protein KP509_15G032300 [Ceratopteris richardii]
MEWGASSMLLLPESVHDHIYGDLEVLMYLKSFFQALRTLEPLYISILSKLSLADTSITETHANFSTCEAQASCRTSDESSLTAECSAAPESQEQRVVKSKTGNMIVEGPDQSTRVHSKGINAWLALAKNKDDSSDDDDDQEEEEEEDEDEEGDDPAEEENAGEEEDKDVEGHVDEGKGEEDNDDDDDENGRDDDEEEEDDDDDGVEGEDEEDEAAAEDEEDEEDEDEDEEDEEDEDEEKAEPPLKKRK